MCMWGFILKKSICKLALFRHALFRPALFRHVADHTISFDDVKVLTMEQHFRKRRYLESLFIQESLYKYKLLNDNHKSLPLYLFNLPPVYRIYNDTSQNA